MYIKDIKYIDSNNLEGDVVVTDGKFELLVYSYPLNYEVGSIIINPLYVFEPSNIHMSDKRVYKVRKLKSHYGYFIRGRLINKEKGIIRVGDIALNINNKLIPSDIKNNQYVQFMCERIDLI